MKGESVTRESPKRERAARERSEHEAERAALVGNGENSRERKA